MAKLVLNALAEKPRNEATINTALQNLDLRLADPTTVLDSELADDLPLHYCCHRQHEMKSADDGRSSPLEIFC